MNLLCCSAYRLLITAMADYWDLIEAIIWVSVGTRVDVRWATANMVHLVLLSELLRRLLALLVFLFIWFWFLLEFILPDLSHRDWTVVDLWISALSILTFILSLVANLILSHADRLNMLYVLATLERTALNLVDMRVHAWIYLVECLRLMILERLNLHMLKGFMILRSIHLNLRPPNAAHYCLVASFKILVLDDLGCNRWYSVLYLILDEITLT